MLRKKDQNNSKFFEEYSNSTFYYTNPMQPSQQQSLNPFLNNSNNSKVNKTFNYKTENTKQFEDLNNNDKTDLLYNNDIKEHNNINKSN